MQVRTRILGTILIFILQTFQSYHHFSAHPATTYRLAGCDMTLRDVPCAWTGRITWCHSGAAIALNSLQGPLDTPYCSYTGLVMTLDAHIILHFVDAERCAWIFLYNIAKSSASACQRVAGIYECIGTSFQELCQYIAYILEVQGPFSYSSHRKYSLSRFKSV
jgi:hypothetical protein